MARLSTAATTGSANYPAWGLQQTYDRYGNRWSQGIISGCVAPMTCPQPSVSFNPATNHINSSGYAYDANGNMTNDGQNTLVYDAENHATSSSGSLGSGTYTYDGNGLRVQKVSSGTTTVYVFSGSKVIAEYDNGALPSAPSREYIYGGSALLAKIDSSGTKYYHQDHLSNRLVTSSTGVILAQLGHFPFGESWYNATGDKLLFTSYERDAESTNDYAQARYYVNRLALFSALDPLPGSTSDPQSLNHYSYVSNDPTEQVDPSGEFPVWGPLVTLAGRWYGTSAGTLLHDFGFGGAGQMWSCPEGGADAGYCTVGNGTWGLPVILPDRCNGVNSLDPVCLGRGTPQPPANNTPKCIPRKSLPWDVRAELAVLGWMAQRSGGVRAIGVGASGAYSPPTLAGGGGSVQGLWMADYLGQQGLYWSVSGGPTVGKKGFGVVGGVQYMTSTFKTTVTVQDVVNSILSLGGGAGAGFGLGVDYSPQTGVFTETIGLGTGGWGGASSLNIASGFIPICKD